MKDKGKKARQTDGWSFQRKLRVIHDADLRRAHRLFKSFPVRPYRTIVDIGAYNGEFARRAAAYWNPERVWLIEANPTMAEALRQAYGVREGWKVLHCAISERSGEIDLRLNAHRESSSILPIEELAAETFGLTMTEIEQVRLPALSLDDLFQREAIGKVDLLKVDIQGAEHLLIKGGRRALESVHSVYLEVNFRRFYEGAALFPEIDALMNESGFRVRSFHETRLGADGALAYANALYVRPRPADA